MQEFNMFHILHPEIARGKALGWHKFCNIINPLKVLNMENRTFLFNVRSVVTDKGWGKYDGSDAEKVGMEDSRRISQESHFALTVKAIQIYQGVMKNRVNKRASKRA